MAEVFDNGWPAPPAWSPRSLEASSSSAWSPSNGGNLSSLSVAGSLKSAGRSRASRLRAVAFDERSRRCLTEDGCPGVLNSWDFSVALGTQATWCVLVCRMSVPCRVVPATHAVALWHAGRRPLNFYDRRRLGVRVPRRRLPGSSRGDAMNASNNDRDRGPGCPGAPPTPPGMRVRTRRLSTSFKTLAEARSRAIESRPSPRMIDHHTVVRPLAGTTPRDARDTYLLVSLQPFPSPLVSEDRYYGLC